MLEDLHAYFYHHVVLRYTTYLKVSEGEPFGQEKDLRASLDAATALYHFREHLPASLQKSRRAWAGLCPDYDLLGDVVNAAKHQNVTMGTPQVTSADAIYEQTVSVEYEDADGTYHDVRKRVRVTLDDGSERDLLEVLTKVVNFWGGHLAGVGAIPDFKPFPLPEAPGSRYVTRAEARRMNIEMTRGLKFEHRMQLLRFDPVKGKAEPIDLSGFTDLQYRIYKPPSITLVAHCRNEAGEEFTRDLELTDEQSATWHGLDTDAERRDFANAIAAERRGQLVELMREANSRRAR